ncbi:MAG: UTP--glucose-1-phosphate uridylyltransferase [Proteobacteria bacterium]|nr:UTP--glucose-1-phosphate uridylyltransferase [Pseudomonadota bacterium]MBW3616523.1 UTP--glucose-1-phosphate uridylyltransferase [Pseudomonadota bacterium]
MAAQTKVRKAVLPVAGFGTRVLPGTKVVAKELLNVVDRPILSYIVAEARAAGIEHFVFVTGRGKAAIEDYFDHHVELEAALESKGKTALLNEIRTELPRPGEMSFVRQMQPLGLGHAVWCARDIVGDEPFAVMLPDMIMAAARPALGQLVDAHARTGGNLILVEPVPEAEVHKYGVVAPDPTRPRQGAVIPISGMVEKPPVGTAPSNLYVNGRYILQPEIFGLLADQTAGAGGEIQLTDAMARLMASQPFHAVELDGHTHDCGDKIGLLRANVAMALARPDLGAAAREAIEELLG